MWPFKEMKKLTKEEAITLLSKERILDKVFRNKEDFEKQYSDMFVKNCRIIASRIEYAIKEGYNGVDISTYGISLPDFGLFKDQHKRMVSEIEEILKRDYVVKYEQNRDGSFYRMEITWNKG